MTRPTVPSVATMLLLGGLACHRTSPPPPSSTAPSPAPVEPEAHARKPTPREGPIGPVHIRVEPLPTSTDGPPSARAFPQAVWTGSHVLVWGGDDAVPSEATGYAPVPPHPLGDGASYDPAADRWEPLPAAPIAARFESATAWTGREMLLWGGVGPQGVLADGAAFDPATKRWRPVARSGAPSARAHIAATWTGRTLWIFGGEDDDGVPKGDGATFDPAADRWAPLSSAGAPSARTRAHAVLLVGAVLLWGGNTVEGWQADGALFDLETGAWRAIETDGAPTAADPVVVSTGEQVLVWGGWRDGPVAAGARYDPGTDSWTPMSHDGAFARAVAHGVWAGGRLAVLGEVEDPDAFDLTLGLYDPALDRWWNATGGYPMHGSALVWTGTELVSWGGFDGNNDTWEGTRLRLPPPP